MSFALHKLTCGWVCWSSREALLLKVRCQIGYPRFFVIAAIGLARLLLGNEAAPPGCAWVVLAACLTKIGEDFFVAVLQYLGLRKQVPLPKHRSMLDLTGQPAFRSVMPDDAWAVEADRNEHANSSVTTLIIGNEYRCSKQATFETMQLWSHAYIIHTAQVQMLFLMIIFGSGVVNLLGLCHDSVSSASMHGVLTWQYMDLQSLCSGHS